MCRNWLPCGLKAGEFCHRYTAEVQNSPTSRQNCGGPLALILLDTVFIPKELPSTFCVAYNLYDLRTIGSYYRE
jgi:hypothetical protein